MPIPLYLIPLTLILCFIVVSGLTARRAARARAVHDDAHERAIAAMRAAMLGPARPADPLAERRAHATLCADNSLPWADVDDGVVRTPDETRTWLRFHPAPAPLTPGPARDRDNLRATLPTPLTALRAAERAQLTPVDELRAQPGLRNLPPLYPPPTTPADMYGWPGEPWVHIDPATGRITPQEHCGQPHRHAPHHFGEYRDEPCPGNPIRPSVLPERPSFLGWIDLRDVPEPPKGMSDLSPTAGQAFSPPPSVDNPTPRRPRPQAPRTGDLTTDARNLRADHARARGGPVRAQPDPARTEALRAQAARIINLAARGSLPVEDAVNQLADIRAQLNTGVRAHPHPGDLLA